MKKSSTLRSTMLSCLLLCSIPATHAAVIGWELHNNTNHPVDIEIFKHCMSSTTHDGLSVIQPGASYNYEELGTVNSGTCFFEASYFAVRIYDLKFRKSFVTNHGCFTDGPENVRDGRVNMTPSREGCKLKVRFDINK